MMFKPLVTQFLQHITHQNNWSREHLIPYAGKVVQFNIIPIKTKLIILEDGGLGVAPNHALADATVHIPPSLAIRLIAKDEAAKMQVRIDGDSHLAAQLAKVLQYIRWDIEEDLSQVIGDIPANKMANLAKRSKQAFKQQTSNMTDMLKEYWQEEKPVLAKKWQIDQFNTNVDSLRSDVNRLEKRLDKFKKRIQEHVH